MQFPIQSYLADLHSRLAGVHHGELASYIPELSKADPNWFGICLVTMDGIAYAVGDADQSFTLQSISKPFVYATALIDRGQHIVPGKVGVEPSGDAFNSISLDPQTGAPLNPMINAGAIATTSLVAGPSAEAQWRRIEQSIARFMGRPVSIDEPVYRSESDTGFRNRAIAWMLKNFGIIEGDPMAVLENYFRQCSILVSCRDLAFMAATLANGGVHPLTGEVALPGEHVERVLSVMASCGMYDYAGSWLYEVGMPAKSGVSGGIVAVVPGQFGIGIFSPLLDEKGNSARGIAACRALSQDFGLHVFAPSANPAMSVGRIYTGADAPSRRKPSPEARDCLDDNASRIKYLCLHGYLAVAAAEFIIRRMRDMAEGAHSFILDMHEVTGISEPAARLLNEARHGFGGDDIAVVASRIRHRARVLSPLRKSVHKGDRGFLVFEDNDLAVEWCENRLLVEFAHVSCDAGTLADSRLLRGLTPDLLDKVAGVARTQDYGQGAQILTQGEVGDGRVFFIESGQVSVLVPLPNGAHQRVATLGAGMEFGETALLGHTTRGASVHADTDVRCRVLESSDFLRLSAEAPQLKICVLENLANDMADRLRGANQWIAALA
jgi:glutaminase